MIMLWKLSILALSVHATPSTGSTLQLRGMKAASELKNEFSSESMQSLKRGLACTSNEWHIDFTKTSGYWCTNSLVYPGSIKNDPSMIQPSAEACCDRFFSNLKCEINKACETEEVAAAPSSPSQATTTTETAAPCGAWHVSTIGHRDTCTNDMEYPDAWNLPQFAAKQLFETAGACCDAIHVGKPVCHKTNVCLPGLTSTSTATSPTSKPTPRPTPRPTPNPTEPLVEYYSIPSTGICAVVDEDTPSWIDEFYTDWEKCCKKGWVFEKCMDEAPPGAIVTETTSTTTTTTKTRYYVVQTSGKCMPVDKQTPSWMGESNFFDDYTLCCKKSWNTDACLAYGVSLGLSTLDPTPSPTTDPTAIPTSRPTSDPTSLPTSHPTIRPSLNPTTADPTKNPTASPSVPKLASASASAESSTNACESALWHPTEDFSKCTNSPDFPSIWSNAPHKDTFLHANKETCCEVFFDSWGRDCETEDTCKVATCDSAPWHPSEDYSKCTNDLNYNDAWNNPPLNESYLHDSSDDCCELFFNAWGKECVVENICE